MRRREFVSLLSGAAAVAAVLWLSITQAQQSDRLRALQIGILRTRVEAVADKIGQFFREMESQIGWTTQLPWSAGTIDQRRLDGLRLLRQVVPITELAQLDSAGIEQLKVSRLAMDVVANQADFSKDPKFTEAVAKKVYYGPVFLLRQSPYMTMSVAGTRHDAGVSVALLSPSHFWDIIKALKVGAHGVAYMLDVKNRVIAHSNFAAKVQGADGRDGTQFDLSLFQQDFSNLPHVQKARALSGDAAGRADVGLVQGSQGREVLSAYALISPTGWLAVVEVPMEEADALLQ
jgi:hypothetical protein